MVVSNHYASPQDVHLRELKGAVADWPVFAPKVFKLKHLCVRQQFVDSPTDPSLASLFKKLFPLSYEANLVERVYPSLLRQRFRIAQEKGELFHLLLLKSLRIGFPERMDLNPVTYAAGFGGHRQQIEEIFSSDRVEGAGEQQKLHLFYTLAKGAVEGGQITLLKQVLGSDMGSRIPWNGEEGLVHTFVWAVENGNHQVVGAILVSTQAEVITEAELWNAVYSAARLGHYQVVKEILNSSPFRRIPMPQVFKHFLKNFWELDPRGLSKMFFLLNQHAFSVGDRIGAVLFDLVFIISKLPFYCIVALIAFLLHSVCGLIYFVYYRNAELD